MNPENPRRPPEGSSEGWTEDAWRKLSPEEQREQIEFSRLIIEGHLEKLRTELRTCPPSFPHRAVLLRLLAALEAIVPKRGRPFLTPAQATARLQELLKSLP